MVVRTRFRALMVPLVLYAVCGLASSYFVWHAVNGQRGLKARDDYMQRLAELETTLSDLRAERARWRLKIDLARGETVDRDLVEEESRIMLGRVHKNEVIVLHAIAAGKGNR